MIFDHHFVVRTRDRNVLVSSMKQDYFDIDFLQYCTESTYYTTALYTRDNKINKFTFHDELFPAKGYREMASGYRIHGDGIRIQDTRRWPGTGYRQMVPGYRIQGYGTRIQDTW